MPISFEFWAGIAVKATGLLFLGWLATRLMCGASAAMRHVVWSCVFLSLLALPLLALVVPARQAPHILSAGYFFAQATATPETQTTIAHGNMSQRIFTGDRWRTFDWRAAAILVWAGGTAACWLHLLVAYAALLGRRRRARPFVSLMRKNGVPVLEASSGMMPMAAGISRPAILLPPEAAAWTRERLELVLEHELAHIRRADVLMNLIARIGFALYWWNPMTWLGWREFLTECERATDDAVLNSGARPSVYAGHLLQIARTMQISFGIAGMPTARRSQVERRVRAILDPAVNRRSSRRVSACLAAFIAIAVLAPLSALRAQQNGVQALPPDIDAFVRSATAQRNYEMLDQAATAAEDQWKYDIAQKLREASRDVRQEVGGDASAIYGIGILNLGQLETKRGNFDAAAALYTQAVAILGDSQQSAPALLRLGINALKGNPEASVAYFQRSRLADPKLDGSAALWTAIAREREGNASDADTYYRNALSLENPNSLEEATVMQLYARFLRDQNRIEEAQQLETQAAQVRKSVNPDKVYSPTPAELQPLRIGRGVPPTLKSKIEPGYTEEARVAKYQGTVTLSVEVGTDGYVHNIRILRPLGLGLDEKAVEAVSHWIFSPATKDGQPVPVLATVEVNFRLL